MGYIHVPRILPKRRRQGIAKHTIVFNEENARDSHGSLEAGPRAGQSPMISEPEWQLLMNSLREEMSGFVTA
jgi:hypothetical protein